MNFSKLDVTNLVSDNKFLSNLSDTAIKEIGQMGKDVAACKGKCAKEIAEFKVSSFLISFLLELEQPLINKNKENILKIIGFLLINILLSLHLDRL